MLHKWNTANIATGIAVSLCFTVGLQKCAKCAPAQGQSTVTAADNSKITHTLSGTVRSADSGLVRAGALVIITGADGHHLELKTNEQGQFQSPELRSGKYTIVVQAQGLLSQSRKVNVESANIVNLDFSLEDLEVADVLRVTGKRMLIHPENTAPTTYINKKTIEKYKTGNSLRDLVSTAPGLSQDSFGNMVVRGEHNTINYVLDDVVLPEAVGQIQQGQIISPHSLQSIDVTTGGYQAKDGGGPMGAVVNLQSLPIGSKPMLHMAMQMGGPLAGGINYETSSPLSLDKNSKWNHVRFQSSGQIFANKLGVEPPTRHFTRNARVDINSLTKLEWQITERDRLRLTASINETFMHIPTSKLSRSAGFKENQHDRQNFVILSYKHQYEKWLDEGNLNFVGGFQSQHLGSTNVFNPDPIFNGGITQLISAAPNAKRYNFSFSTQGNIKKTAFKTHHLTAGFLSEVKPVKTFFNAYYYNADRGVTAAAQTAAQSAGQSAAQASSQAAIQAASDAAQQQAIADALAAGASNDDAAAAGANAAAAAAQTAAADPAIAKAAADAGAAASAGVPQVPYGGLISPFTNMPGGPQILGPVGQFKGFRFLQSAYVQDHWTPENGAWKRLTADAGVRFDLYHGVYGQTLNLANLLAQQPGIDQFNIKPFMRNTVTNAQASGRYGLSYLLTRNTVLRSSYSEVFTPPPVDLFVRPFDITGGTINGIWNGSLRPMQATRGRIVDVSVEQQVGPRFSIRTSAYYKRLHNVGDETPVNNTILYQRLTLSALESYGVENLIQLKPARDGSGLFGFASNTIMVAKLRGNKKDSGGLYDIDSSINTAKYIDHDRRHTLQAGLGYQSKRGYWIMANISEATGFLNGLDRAVFGTHPSRTRPVVICGLNVGWNAPPNVKHAKLTPTGVDVRITNIANNVVPINIGSPFQGTRYTLPFQVLAQMHWAM